MSWGSSGKGIRAPKVLEGIREQAAPYLESTKPPLPAQCIHSLCALAEAAPVYMRKSSIPPQNQQRDPAVHPGEPLICLPRKLNIFKSLEIFLPTENHPWESRRMSSGLPIPGPPCSPVPLPECQLYQLLSWANLGLSLRTLIPSCLWLQVAETLKFQLHVKDEQTQAQEKKERVKGRPPSTPFPAPPRPTPQEG